MKAKEFIVERASPIVYHYTRLYSALKIVMSGKFELSSTIGSIETNFAPKGKQFFLSCTRTKMGGYHDYIGSDAVMFNLDGNYYNSRYTARAVDYWNNRDMTNPNYAGKRHEAEDRIFSSEPTIPIDGILSIHIYVEPMDAKKRENWGEGTPAMARQLIIAAKKRGIKCYLYEDKDAWRLQDIRRSVPITKRETLSGQEKTGRNYTGRMWLEPWLELLYKDRTEALSKKAQEIAYTLTYDNDYYFKVMVSGFGNDMANARKPGAGLDRGAAVKIIQYMQRNGYVSLADLIKALQVKWRKVKEHEQKVRQ